MVRIYFVRHGQSEANVQRVISNRGWKHPLTDLGRAQAEALAERLQGESISRIISSPIMRAVQTAEIVSARLGIPFTMEEALRENDNGSLEGRGDYWAWQRYVLTTLAWRAGLEQVRIADGENLVELRARFTAFIDRLRVEFGGSPERILLVAHGGLYRAGLPAVVEKIEPAFAWRHTLPNTGLVLVEERAGVLECLQWDGADLGRRAGSRE